MEAVVHLAAIHLCTLKYIKYIHTYIYIYIYICNMYVTYTRLPCIVSLHIVGCTVHDKSPDLCLPSNYVSNYV